MMNKTDCIQDLKSFIYASKQQIFSIMTSLGFHITKSIMSEESSDHIIGNFSTKSLLSVLKEHLSKAESSTSSLLGPLLPSYPIDERFTCVIDPVTRKKLLQPQRGNGSLPAPASSSDEFQANYSAIEKNILYQYALSNTQRIESPPELSIPEVSDEKVNIDEKDLPEEEQFARRLEAMKKERDLKRRRMAYRKVSTKNKSQTEITKEVISNLMEALFGEKTENTLEETQPSAESNYSGTQKNEDWRKSDSVGSYGRSVEPSSWTRERDSRERDFRRRNESLGSDRRSSESSWRRERDFSLSRNDGTSWRPNERYRDYDRDRNRDYDRSRDRSETDRNYNRDSRDRYRGNEGNRNKYEERGDRDHREKGEDRRIKEGKREDEIGNRKRERDKHKRENMYDESDANSEEEETLDDEMRNKKSSKKDKRKRKDKRRNSSEDESHSKRHKKKKKNKHSSKEI